MSYIDGDVIRQVKEVLKRIGFQNSNLEIARYSGRNSTVLQDIFNNLFVKIYPKKSLLQNCIEAEKLISNRVRVPKLLFVSKTEIEGVGFVGVWELLSEINYNNPNKISVSKINKIAETIFKIHEIKNFRHEFGAHVPDLGKSTDWKDYLKRWIKESIFNSNRIIRGYQKSTIVKLIDDYLEITPLGRNSTASLLHGDIDIANFVFTSTHHVAVVDLDYSIYGDPAWEFASAVANWKFSAPCYGAILNKYLELSGYQQKQKQKFIERVRKYGPIKKAVLLYAIKDISSLVETEEMKQCINEMNAA